MTTTVKRLTLGHHMTVDHLRRVFSCPAHKLEYLHRFLSWHAARNKGPTCTPIHLITIPESSCSRS